MNILNDFISDIVANKMKNIVLGVLEEKMNIKNGIVTYI